VLTNYLCTVHLVALSEALTVAKVAGLDLNTAYEAIRISSGNSFVHETESQVILNGSRDINFTMDLVIKDVGLFDAMARAQQVPLELSPLVLEIFRDGARRFGPREFSANIIRRLEEPLGVRVLGEGFPAQIVDDEPKVAGYEVSARHAPERGGLSGQRLQARVGEELALELRHLARPGPVHGLQARGEGLLPLVGEHRHVSHDARKLCLGDVTGQRHRVEPGGAHGRIGEQCIHVDGALAPALRHARVLEHRQHESGVADAWLGHVMLGLGDDPGRRHGARGAKGLRPEAFHGGGDRVLHERRRRRVEAPVLPARGRCHRRRQARHLLRVAGECRCEFPDRHGRIPVGVREYLRHGSHGLKPHREAPGLS